jgi:urease accessory protein
LDALPPAAVSHQRARGELTVTFGLRDTRTVLRDLRQDGCLKARFPRGEAWTEAIILNSSGGVAGGDRLANTLAVQQGARATFTTQAAERFYRALPGDPPADLRTTIAVAPNAHAEWLPQESILFDRCALNRTLNVNIAAGGNFLGAEMLVFGRTAMGETVATARLHDTIRIRHAGRLLLHDAIRLDGEVATLLDHPATAAGARAIATLVYVGENTEQALDALRAAWEDAPASCGASAWNGMLVGRVVAQDGAPLRAAMTMGLRALRGPRALPVVWTC